ncbi:NAD kinase [hydrothermal vent metagenome]|uniref:NAD kinase n=1 Tax=hydrothermal vent metagenome TaxID=652676 RepID=A0A3B0VGT0_9ZZZZ
MNIRFVGIITKRNTPKVQQQGSELAAWFSRQGVRAELDQVDPEMDMLVILGGDGTLLHVADQASRYDLPVVGINMGYLGFLTEVAAAEMYHVLRAIMASRVHIERRMMLNIRLVSTSPHRDALPVFALNEVAIVKGNAEKVISLCSWADEEYITTYKADGLIISTPTGSTAYNLSAGGPIVHPELDVLLVTPICPFMLESRPLLLSPQTRISTRLAAPAGDVKVMVDGRFSGDMRENDYLLVEAAAKPLQLISSPHKGYFSILRNKLNWGGREPAGHPLPELTAHAGQES